MSDRLAVFNDGRIEQVGAPPRSTSIRRTSSWPASSGVSNIARARRAPASPSARRRSASLEAGEGASDGLHVEHGQVRDVAYIGMVTRFFVDLDAGGELQVVRQNLEMSSQEALEQRGRQGAGRLARRARVLDPRSPATTGGGSSEKQPRRWWSWLALLDARAGGARRRPAAAATTTTTAGAARRPQRGADQASAKGEGKVNMIAWAGYVEDGSTDPAVDWVSDFEKETGCQVNVKVGNTSDEMVTLMRTGQLRRRVGLGRRHAAPDRGRRRGPGEHRPGPELQGHLRRRSRTSRTTPSTGSDYGIPHGRGANLLMWNTDVVKPAPDSWSVVFDDERRSTRARSPPTTTRSTSPTRRCT